MSSGKGGQRGNPEFAGGVIQVDHQELRRLTRQFRTAIKQCDPESFPWPWFPTEFPRGCCGNACILLAEYFEENGCGQFDYCSGERGEWSHAWLELGRTIVDFTADQFEDQTESVIVTLDRAWHDTFEPLHRVHPEFIAAWDERTQVLCRRAYRLILDRIAPER